MNILFITEIAPFPPNTGERIRSYNLINSLLQFADRLILLAGNPPPEEEKYGKIVFYQLPRLYSRSRWVNLLWIFFRRSSMISTVKRMMDTHPVDLVFLDYNYIGNYISLFRKRGVKVIYGTHNVQSLLNYQIPAETLKDIVFKNVCFVMEKLHERVFFKLADAVIAVSDEDLEHYRRYIDHSRLHMIPNYINEGDYQHYHVAAKKNRVVMSGTFRAFQNIAGLRWFLEEVWDEELAGMADFLVVGHGSSEHFDHILSNKKAFANNAAALGTVDSVKEYIAESKVAIIPLLHGSGTRLKCIEAMALKTMIVGTSVGVEGIKHGGAVITADTPDDFRKGLKLALLNEGEYVEKAYAVYLEHYSSSANTPRIKKILDHLLSKDS